jgi:hypothetical protein
MWIKEGSAAILVDCAGGRGNLLELVTVEQLEERSTCHWGWEELAQVDEGKGRKYQALNNAKSLAPRGKPRPAMAQTLFPCNVLHVLQACSFPK